MAVPKKLDPLIIENARIILKNLAGVEKKYNAPGERNFAIALDGELAEEMIKAGWNIKFLKPREEGDLPQAILKVKINTGKGRPPRVVIVSSKGRTSLTEDMYGMIDYADIENVDLAINPSFWERDGRSGYTAYLRSIFVTIREDELDLKYADLDEVGPSGEWRAEESVPF